MAKERADIEAACRYLGDPKTEDSLETYDLRMHVRHLRDCAAHGPVLQDLISYMEYIGDIRDAKAKATGRESCQYLRRRARGWDDLATSW